MNRAAFFDTIRPAFAGWLSQPQVDGMNALLDAGADLPLHHMAHVLANVRRETGGYMSPIKETVMPWHKTRVPSDAEVKRRLEHAWTHGKLSWVKTPYWRDGWFGRGQIQITHRENYAKFGITNPDDALHLPISAHIAVRGMRDGMFTGRKLSDYRFPDAMDAAPPLNPRRIVNGQDGSDAEVARFHREFAKALGEGGWGLNPPVAEVAEVAAAPAERPVDAPKPDRAPADAQPTITGLQAFLRALAALFGGKA